MGKYANAAVAMLKWLQANEIKGGPVAQPSKRDPTIMVYGMEKDGIKQLPKTFGGFQVTGTIESPNYEKLPIHDLVPVK